MLKFNLQLFADQTITSGGTYTISESNSTITIATDEEVTLTGSSATTLDEVYITTTADNANLTINNLNISNYSNAIITLGDGANNQFNFTGTNTLEVQNIVNNQSGACVNVGGGVTINGTGTLNATSFSGACIGIDGSQNKSTSNITIESGTYNLTARQGACAIGGAGSANNAIGDILITGTANITASTPNGYAAAVGASYRGSCGNITINGNATFNASSGQATAVIGAAAFTTVGDITIGGNATVTAENTSTSDAPAGIGSGVGAKCMSIGNIVIGGNANVTASSTNGLAIDNHEWYREDPVLINPETENDHAIENEDATITIGESATFSGTSGDVSTYITINGENFNAETISYSSTAGLTYSGGVDSSDETDTTILDITAGGSYTIAEGSVGKILINTTAAVTLSGGNYTLENVRILTEAATADLTINNLKIYNPETSVIRLGASAGNKLNISGTNDFSNNIADPAIINVGGGVDIDGDGSLKIVTTHGSAIGTDRSEDLGTSNIVISGGTFDLTNNSGGACIGGCGNTSKIGDITITGTANIKASNPAGYAAAIGAGYRGEVGDIVINGDATVEASTGQVGAAIGGTTYSTVGDITIGGRASIVASGTDESHAEAAIGGNTRDQLSSLGNITITEDATVVASSASGLAINNLVYVTEAVGSVVSGHAVNSDNPIRLYGDTTTSAQSVVILNNGSSDIVTIGADSYSPIMGHRDVYSAYQGDKMVFYDGGLAMTGNWTSLESGGWEYNSVVQRALTGVTRDDKSAHFTISGGNLTDSDSDGIPDNVSIGSIIYIQQSGVHTNISHLSGNVVYNGDALGIENDTDYNIEAISPIDLSETFAGTYITDPNVTAMRGISNGATVSPRGTAGTSTASDWISLDSTDCSVTFMDGAYCVYTENKFSSRSYTQLSISNNNQGVVVSTADDFIQTIGNLADGYALTIESGINVGERINFETEGSGVIVVKTTANSGKYSLAADSDEWQYQRYTINGGEDFTFVFGDNGSVVGMENFEGTLSTDDTTLSEGEWVTLSGGKFQYTGAATNNPSKSVTFTIGGASIASADNFTVTNHLYMGNDSHRIGLLGLNGNATVDNVVLNVDGDTLYAAHFSTSGQDASGMAILEISDGATVNNNYSAGVDNDALVKFIDGIHTVFTSDKLQTRDFTTINASNGGEGFSLNVSDGNFETISGLNDGYEVTIVAGGNISDSVAINTDGGAGVIQIQNGDTTETFSLAGGDDDFGFTFTDDSIELVNYDGWLPISSGVYQYYSDLAQFTISGDNFDPNVARVPANVQFGAEYRLGVVGLNGNVTINGVETGIINDSDYSIHAHIPVDGTEIAITSAFNVSDGASVNGAVTSVLIDGDAEVNFADGNYTVGTMANYSARKYDTISVDNGGNGFTLTASDGSFENISGLNDGYAATILTGGNFADSLSILSGSNSGSLNFDNVDLNLDGDTNLYFTDNTSGGTIDLSDSTVDGGIIFAQGSKATAIGSNGDDTLFASAKNSYLVGGAGADTFIRGVREANQSIIVADFEENEDEVYHGRPFADFSLLSVAKSSGNDYIFEVGGSTIKYLDGANKKLKFVDVNGDVAYFGNYLTIRDYDADTITATAKVSVMDAAERTNDIRLKGNAIDNTIYGGAGNDTIITGGGSDVYVYQGGNDVITDYKAGKDSIQLNPALITNSTVNGADVVLTTDSGTLTLKSTKNKAITFVDEDGNATEKVFSAGVSYAPLDTGLNYDATGIALTANNKFEGNEIDLGDYLSTVIKVNASSVAQNLNIIGNDNDNSIKGGKGADTILGGSGNDILIGENGNDEISGGDGDDSLNGGSGNDTLIGGAGNNTLTGGAGDDVFVYAGGNDLITDYKAGKDSIQLNLDSITGSTVSGSDVILTTGEGDITLKSVKNKVITFVDESGNSSERIFFADTSYAPLDESLSYNSSRTKLTVGSRFTGNEIDLSDYLSTVAKVNASSVAQNLNIIGNDNDISIKGGTGADTISGGTGDDTLTGGAGADVFVYNGGNDLITDYTADEDTITINGTVSEVSYTAQNAVFTIGDGTLTVKNDKGRDISVTDSAGTQIYSRTQELLESSNFLTAENNLDAISNVTENNYSIGQMDYSNDNNSFTSNNSIVAASFDKK